MTRQTAVVRHSFLNGASTLALRTLVGLGFCACARRDRARACGVRRGRGSNEFVLYGTEPPADFLARCAGGGTGNGTGTGVGEAGGGDGEAKGDEEGVGGGDEEGEEDEGGDEAADGEGPTGRAGDAGDVDGAGGAAGDEVEMTQEQAVWEGWQLVVKAEVRSRGPVGGGGGGVRGDEAG